MPHLISFLLINAGLVLVWATVAPITGAEVDREMDRLRAPSR